MGANAQFFKTQKMYKECFHTSKTVINAKTTPLAR